MQIATVPTHLDALVESLRGALTERLEAVLAQIQSLEQERLVLSAITSNRDALRNALEHLPRAARAVDLIVELQSILGARATRMRVNDILRVAVQDRGLPVTESQIQGALASRPDLFLSAGRGWYGLAATQGGVLAATA